MRRVFSSGNRWNGFDKTSDAIRTVGFEHSEIHEGKHFFVCGFEVLASGASAVFGVTTPNTSTWTHMVFEVNAMSQMEVHVFENASFSSGSATRAVNNNRNSSNAAATVVVHNPTVASYGTAIFSQSIGKAGTPPAAADAAGVVLRRNEILLKQNTKYLFVITSRDNANTVSYCGEWYEHTDAT